MPGGRPSRIEEVKDRLIENIRLGVPIATAAIAAGIAERSYYEWKEKAEEDNKKGLSNKYTQFLQELKEAEHEAEQRLLKDLSKDDRPWQAKAWILERRFGYKEQKDHNHQIEEIKVTRE